MSKITQSFECATASKTRVIEREARSMKKRKAKRNYIQMRIEMLEKERDNPHNSDIDSEWYNRIIQELVWAQQVLLEDKEPTNCFMEKTQQG